MARWVRLEILAVACCGTALAWIAAGVVEAAPAWESGGRAYEVSDLPSVVAVDSPRPIDGQPPLPPEPEDSGLVLGDEPVAEGDAAPTLSERIREFVPSVSDIMPYDSSAAIEPDGTVVEGSTWSGVADGMRCYDDTCWVFRAEALALWRNAPASRPLFTTLSGYRPGPPATGTIGPTALDANQLESDPLAASRLSLARLDECGRGFDAGYLWAGNFYAQRSLPELTDGYAVASPGMYGNEWGLIPPAPPISSATATLIGSLQSAEINYREPLGWGANRFLIGFRWLQWREAFSMTDTFYSPTLPRVMGNDFWRTDCLNNLYGGQIGIDSMLWNSGKGLRLESLVKAGAYYNAPFQSSGYYYVNSAPFQSPYATISVNQPPVCSFVGEVGLTGVVPIRRNLDLRVGYFGLWLSGLAQPTRQLSGQTLIPTTVDTPSGTLTANGSVVLQGVSLGLEGRW